jgi:DNA polymerase III alpha subunit
VVEGGIRLGLESIKHIGPAACCEIMNRRPFSSMEDMESRTQPRALNVTSRGALVMSGACDEWGLRDEFTEDHIDECERDLLGMSLTSIHSIAAYADAIDGKFWTEDDFDDASDGTRVAVVGEVVGIKEHVAINGGLMAFVDLAYGPNRWSCTIFANLYAEYKDLLGSRRPLLIAGTKNTYKGRSGIRVEALPSTADTEWVPPVMDLSAYVEMVGDEAEQLAGDSVYPEDLIEQIEIGVLA